MKKYTAYVRAIESGRMLSDPIHCDNIRECWELAFSEARYWRDATFQIIADRGGKKYKRYNVY